MLFLLSPAKSLDYDTPVPEGLPHTTPQFVPQSQALIEVLRQKNITCFALELLPRISRAIDDGSFFENAAYNKAMDDCLEKGSSLHLHGLLSDGGVHSHITHLFALVKMAKEQGLEKVDRKSVV